MKSQIKSGWQCPCCQVVYAPSVMKCECAKVAKKVPDLDDKLEAFKKIRDEMDKAAIKQRPFYPPHPYYLAPPPRMPWQDPVMCSITGETPEMAKFVGETPLYLRSL